MRAFAVERCSQKRHETGRRDLTGPFQGSSFLTAFNHNAMSSTSSSSTLVPSNVRRHTQTTPTPSTVRNNNSNNNRNRPRASGGTASVASSSSPRHASQSQSHNRRDRNSSSTQSHSQSHSNSQPRARTVVTAASSPPSPPLTPGTRSPLNDPMNTLDKRNRIPITPAVLRNIFASSRTLLEERTISRVAFFRCYHPLTSTERGLMQYWTNRFAGFLLSCLGISLAAARGRPVHGLGLKG